MKEFLITFGVSVLIFGWLTHNVIGASLSSEETVVYMLLGLGALIWANAVKERDSEDS